MSVQGLTWAEVRSLQSDRVDVQLAEVADVHGLDALEQAAIDAEVAVMEADVVRGASTFRKTPSMLIWTKFLTKAVSLHPIYSAATLACLGEGVAEDAFDVPLDLGRGRVMTARQALAARKGPAAADQEIDDYVAFIRAPFDDWCRFLFRGLPDGRGIRNRVAVAADLVIEHVAGSGGRELVSASLACGAAGPVYALVDSLEGRLGASVTDVVLVDIDVMALASARSLAQGTPVAGRVRLIQQNLLRGPLAGEDLPAHSVHIADALGLIEYLPERLAISLLARVREQLMAPGGLVVFGNMLRHRPQTVFLQDVVGWPAMHHRDISTMLRVLDAAGYDVSGVRVRVTPDGVYAVYAVPV
jgi:hypothetical protein